MSNKTTRGQDLWIWKEMTVTSFKVEHYSEISLEILRKTVKAFSHDIGNPDQHSNPKNPPPSSDDMENVLTVELARDILLRQICTVLRPNCK
jgi:hypothetical protein